MKKILGLGFLFILMLSVSGLAEDVDNLVCTSADHQYQLTVGARNGRTAKARLLVHGQDLGPVGNVTCTDGHDLNLTWICFSDTEDSGYEGDIARGEGNKFEVTFWYVNARKFPMGSLFCNQ